MLKERLCCPCQCAHCAYTLTIGTAQGRTGPPETNVLSKTAYCTSWGSDKNARRVSGLTHEERTAIRRGETVWISECPEYKGTTLRRIVEIGGRFYARMPNDVR